MLSIIMTLVLQDFCKAQESIALQALGEKAVQKQWEVSLPTPLDQLTFNYAILNDGVVTYSQKNRTLMCFGFDGKLKWEKGTSEYPAAQLFASPNGEYLTVCYILAEDAGTTVIYNNRGEVLRQSDYCTGYFSISSKYMIGLGSRPVVLNSRTGEILWHKMEDRKYRNWNVISTEDDQLVVYAGGSLELFDLPTGKRLWQRDVSPSVFNSINLKVAQNGSLITLQFLVFMNINKNFTFVYNIQGNLLHRVEKPIVVNKSNGGIIEAISEEGQYLAFADGEEFYVCSAKTLDRIWTINERIIPSTVYRFTKNLLTFKPSSDSKTTRVFVLNNNGQIEKDYRFNQILDFNTPAHLLESEETPNLLKSGPKQKQTITVIPALEIDEKRLGGVILSLHYLATTALQD
jgi:outer membrane protein assembly factor BamB